MDLCSLPEEMLASVLKYSNFETINKIRKTNERMDAVVKRNKLNKLDIEYLTLTHEKNYNGEKKFKFYFGITDVEQKFERMLEADADERTVVKIVRKYLKKFRCVRILSLVKLNVNSSLLQLLLKYKSLFRVEMYVSDCTVYAPAEELAALLEGARESEVEGNSWPVLGGVSHGANDEIACALIPATPDLSFWSNTMEPVSFPGVTDKTLKCLGKHPKKFFSFYFCDIGATPERVVKLAKKAFANGHEFEYTLGRIKVTDREEGLYYANQMKLIEGVDADIFVSYDDIRCTLTRGCSKLNVEFHFDMFHENNPND